MNEADEQQFIDLMDAYAELHSAMFRFEVLQSILLILVTVAMLWHLVTHKK